MFCAQRQHESIMYYVVFAADGPIIHQPQGNMSKSGATVEWYWRVELEGHAEETAPLPLSLPQFRHELDLGANPCLNSALPTTNGLSYGTECTNKIGR
jgi:hypothetical protein